jgi:uncharacterized membrane protein
MDSKFFKKFLFGGSAIFSAVSVFLLVLWLIIFSDTHDALAISISVYRLLMLALYSYILAFAFSFARLEEFAGWLRVAVNYLLVTSGFFVCIYMPVAQEQANPAGPFVVIALIAAFSVLYFLCYGVYKIIATVGEKKAHKKAKKGISAQKVSKEEYAPMFKKTK